jgi:hypothetical protein
MNRRSMLSMMLAAGSWPLTRDVFAKAPQSPTSVAIDGRTPRLGTYLGAGCTGASKLKAFEQWLGRDVDQMIDFIPWDSLQAARTWELTCWKKIDQRTMVFSLPMVQHASELGAAAEGKFDDLFRRYAEMLVRSGYSSAVIRIGWEFNGNWYAWAASKDPQAWIACWRRIATTMRETPGAAFRFDWCPTSAAHGFKADRAYPGDDVVDFIGLDYYNTPLDKNDKSSDPPEQRWQSRLSMQHGLEWQRDFARSHRKLMSLPEWGTGVHKKWGGPADDPYFIEAMAAWINENSIAYHNYWDYRAKDIDCKLSDGRQPQAAAAFQRYFGGRGRVSSALLRSTADRMTS